MAAAGNAFDTATVTTTDFDVETRTVKKATIAWKDTAS